MGALLGLNGDTSSYVGQLVRRIRRRYTLIKGEIKFTGPLAVVIVPSWQINGARTCKSSFRIYFGTNSCFCRHFHSKNIRT